MKERITQHSSPNFNDRPKDAQVSMLVLHYTGMPTGEDALNRMCDSKAEVSAHYMVDEDGSILQLVDEEKKAWHAGISCWQGRTLLNDTSIGIEIVNPGHEFGYRKFPKEQMVAVKDLCLDIIERHEIPARNVVGHSDIAPSRKQDPGELFEWEWLSRCGVGLWPKRQVVFQPTKALLQLEDVTAGVQRLQQRLSQYGYHLRDDGYFGPKVEYTVEAFKRHFVPDQLNGIWDKKSEAVLSSLLKQVS